MNPRFLLAAPILLLLAAGCDLQSSPPQEPGQPAGEAPAGKQGALHAKIVGEWRAMPPASEGRLFVVARAALSDPPDDGALQSLNPSAEEREHFRKLVALGLHDAFRLFEQPPKSWSWWDYRNLAFRKNQGLRIDIILVSPALKADVTACTIDKLPRKNERPSDHAPVLLSLA